MSLKQFVLKNYTRIECWILIFFLIRFIGITNPPLEISHNWRQTTGLMVARNFLEVDPSIFYARIDDNSGGTGIIGIEFPSMNYVYFLMAKIFGYTHWYGRLINLIVSSFGLFYFYKLLQQARFKERLAFYATLFLTVSIWFSFSRKMMPDTYCISLMFIGLFFGLKYLEEQKIRQLLLYTFFCSLAILSKIPAGIYLVVLAPFLLNAKYTIKSRFLLATLTLIPLALMFWWYFIWNPHVSATYGNWYNSGRQLLVGMNEIFSHPIETLDNFYFDAFFSFVTFGLFLVGLVLMFVDRQKSMIIAFFSVFIVFVVYIFKSGYFFYHHSYYIIPFVPVMALVAAYALLKIQQKWLFYLVFFFCMVESIANQQHDFFIKSAEKYKLTIEPIMNKLSKRNDLIVLNGNFNPQMIYLSHRKGWNCSDDQLLNPSYISGLSASKCKFVVIDKHASVDLNQLKLPFKKVFENDDFLIFSIH